MQEKAGDELFKELVPLAIIRRRAE